MSQDGQNSLGDAATFAGQTQRRPSSEMSLGAERTLGADSSAGIDTAIGDIEIVDLDSRYSIEGTLGQGGMGAVLLATDTRLGRKVAIKRILGEAAGNRMAVQRFLTEAKSIAALNHPNVVQIYDYGRAKDGPFLIMEYVDGGSLLDRCKAGALPLADAIELACQICDGLAKAHDAGIIHRDIKPANVLLTRDGHPKLTDFGLAKAEASDHGQTLTGAVLGTPDFMPPEQRRDVAEVDRRSDLWSLAATVYQMVTGRSPKIIRFDLLPAALTKVLGKALEDEKDSRYQTARELRDAMRTSLRAAATVPATPSTGEGQCPSCGVHNDVSRRFCRSCGGALESPCLSCDKPMPVWEEICGQCGSKQSTLLEARRAEMAAEQAEAEGLLGDLEFDTAAAVATRLRDEPSPRLSHLNAWAEDFLGSIEKARLHQVERAVESLAQVTKHEQEFDYLSAVHVLESVPAAMRSAILPGAREPMDAILARLKRKQAESIRLESLVKQRIAAKAIDGLLPEVDELLALHPDRRDIQKLRNQLVERQQKQEMARDNAIATARSLMASHDYDGAVAAIENVPTAAAMPEGDRLRKEAKSLAARCSALGNEIRSAVTGKRFDGLIDTVDSYLILKPLEPQMVRLRESLVAREDKIIAEIAARVRQAEQLEQSCRFAEAAKILESLPENRRNDANGELLIRCRLAASQRSRALEALAAATAGGYDKAILEATGYSKTLADARLEDAEFTAAFSRIQAAVAEQWQETRRLRMAEKRRALLLILGTIAASVVAVIMLLVSGGLWIRSSLRAASVASALAASRWDDALAIDAGNVAAYEGRAKEKLKRSPPDIDGAFSDIDSAERLSSGLASVKSLRGTAHAVRAAALARGDKLAEASLDLAEAVRPGVDEQALSGARESIIAAWLARADNAVQKRDEAGLKLACDAAANAGAAQVALQDRWRVYATGCVEEMDARSLTKACDELKKHGGNPSEVAMEAMKKDSTLAIELFSSPEAAEVRSGLVSQYRTQFDDCFKKKQWGELVATTSMAARLDPRATLWLETMPLTANDAREIPPELLAALPRAALPSDFIASLPPITNSVGMKLKLLPAGKFTMGEARGDSDRTPHEVTLSQPFYLGVYEVTNGQWRRVMGSVPSSWTDDDRPVETVSWEEAVDFCRKLSALPAEEQAGRVYRLPTEAEWEYACRAGTTTRYSFGDAEGELGEYGWFHENSGGETHPVGKKRPNAWGLYDMHGNVWEWCSDWYGEYPKDAVTDPQGPTEASGRVGRGGGWFLTARNGRSAYRSWSDPSGRGHYLGFRLALSPSGMKPPEAGAGK